MNFLNGRPNVVQLQWMAWVFFYFLIMLSLLHMDTFAQAATYAFLNTIFYAAIIYGNILWLFPRLYQKGRVALYIPVVAMFVVTVSLARGFVMMAVYNSFFTKHPEPVSLKAITSFILGGIVIFLLSFIFRIAIAYFALKRQADEIIAQKTQAELNLLKSQVQPHFLFNTLNNIYYEAYLEAPRTAALIERLSDIMRYFVDESPKKLVSAATEIKFIENYIALEKIRIRYDIEIDFVKQCDDNISIPPMLLMTFVENIFKHGIDKSSTLNKIELLLLQQNDRLQFSTRNTLPKQPQHLSSTGFGIQNLRRRLLLLYQTDFELQTEHQGDIYLASLNIPLK